MSTFVTGPLSATQVEVSPLEEAMQRGVSASEAGDKAAAHEIFRGVTTQYPDALEGWVWLGWTSSDLDEAEAAFRHAHDMDPANEEANLGLRWVSSQRPSTPAEVSPQAPAPEQAVEQVPAPGETSFEAPASAPAPVPQMTGGITSELTSELTAPVTDTSLERTESADDAYASWSVDQMMQIGITAAQAGDKLAAYDMFRKVVAREPNAAEAWVWLGGTSPTLEEAEKAFSRALELNPDSQEAQLGLRWVAVRRSAIQPHPAPESAPVGGSATTEERELTGFARFLAMIQNTSTQEKVLAALVIVALIALLVVWFVWR